MISAISLTYNSIPVYNISEHIIIISYTSGRSKITDFYESKYSHNFFTGSIGLISPPLLIFSAIIYDTASPKPTANKAPVFINNFSSIAVSYFSSSYLAKSSYVSPFFSAFEKSITPPPIIIETKIVLIIDKIVFKLQSLFIFTMENARFSPF